MNALNQSKAQNNNNKEMFRATKLWNEVLHSFFIGISVKKHRKNMKTHYDCFVASEAVDWLLGYLQINENFSEQQISRYQAVNLLRKYLKTGIIERVDVRKEGEEFKDNKELYRFTKEANENLPLISSSNLNARQHLDSTPKTSKCEKTTKNLLNELNLNEKSEVFKEMFFNKISSIIPNFDEFVRKDDLISFILMHNMTRISANCVVQLTDKTEDLPHWVMSAMKCLANWPRASGSGSCLPKYPGFENDVMSVITDYFVNIGIPLIPNQLYALIIHIYDKFSPQPIYENLRQMEILVLPEKTKSHPIIIPCKKPVHTSTPIIESQAKGTTVELPPNHVFETVFMGDTPVTKIVSIDELTNLFTHNCQIRKSRSFRNTQTVGTPKLKPVAESRQLEAVTTMPRSGRRQLNHFKSPITETIYKSQYASPNSSNSSSDSGFGYHNFGFAMQSPTEDGEYMLSKSVGSLSSIHLMDRYNSKDNLSAQFSKSSVDSNNCLHKRTDQTEDKLIEALQLSLLLMPPSNRRHLHLLLRLLSKIINNKEIKLNLGSNTSVKDYFLKTFTRSILCADKEINYNELKAQKVVSILIDNSKDIFKVPNDLLQEIEKLLIDKAKQKLFGENESKQFCQKITTEEFELQRDVLSEYALADLLKSIMTDDRLTDRDKLKWIKQFKLYHPEVYDLYFTDKMSDKPVANRNKKKRMPSRNSNILKRFLSIRL